MSVNSHGQPGMDEYRADLQKKCDELNAQKPIVRPGPNHLGDCEHWHYAVINDEIICVHEPHE